MNYIIDCQTQGKKALIRRLARLKATIDVYDGGAYREELTSSQIRLESTSSLDVIDHWLWKNNFDYIGVVEVKE